MPSAEMLKKLLDEFTDKENSTQTEIKEAEQQLQDLELQVDNCRKKLKFVADDRLKILELMRHWHSNEPSANSFVFQEPETAKVPEASTFNKIASIRKEQKKAPNTVSTQTAPAEPAFTAPEPPPPPPAAAPKPSTPLEAFESEHEEEKGTNEPDDAVKSINDALRGLFS